MDIARLDALLLEGVLTVRDVCRGWNKTTSQVMMAIYKERIMARQSCEGEAWLILKQSVVDLWGDPINELELGL